ncbi:TPA: tRNA (adenosine(37)-N6)-threonylcarbamoyltransferase complex transferase subunit TsaD [Candidatus Nomurabacteria bacterium]|nr:MAG: putative tRNA threonylcarbamoyladenosine biosynthesis protein Gcp [Parcubacteria bacterium RAAC4_OD1_1]HCY26674.1 tRNA (adenosine(37)-N6)-threonylcarbamoyltransferase complex transferase subunit TsaD [Candidatus Nomurabacteria bacterium]
MKILAIETSCDETAIAIVEIKQQGKTTKFKILGNEVSSQIDIHKEYGGVYPALAKREHIKNLPLVFEKVLRKAKIREKDINKKINAIAVTTGPGLEPALWTGIVFAKELSSKYKLPIVPVNHMEGHIFSIFPKKGKNFTIKNTKELFPMLTLLVSGGHTELVFIKNWMKYKKIGQTRDDAVGEAFDKVARMMGLPYPGGPEIGKLASMERENVVPESLAQADGPSTSKNFSRNLLRADGNNISSEILEIKLPRPMMYSKDYDFSFSGLKTAVLYMIRDIGELTDDIKRKIAKEFEDAAFEVLSYKTMKAIREYKIKTLIVGGGVSASPQLKKVITNEIKKVRKSDFLKIKAHFPGRGHTGDNALMIAIAGYYQYKNKKYTTKLGSIKANGNLSL